MYFLVASLGLLLVSTRVISAQKHFEHRIYDGKNASIKSYPYQVSIESFGHQTCGGSIISSNWIVTAGHCTNLDFSPEYFRVRSGSSLKEQGGSVHQVDRIVLHPDFGRTKRGIPLNDLALFRVKQPFVFDDTRRSIKLFGPREKVAPGKVANVTGWGRTRTGYPDSLQAVEVPVIDTKLCDEAYRATVGGVPNGYICASYYNQGGRNACTGDSGGPLAVEGRLAGIVSWSHDCAHPLYPTVYTDVAYYREWIDDVVSA